MNRVKKDIKTVIFDVGGVLIENPWKGMMHYFAGLLQLKDADFEIVLKEIYDDFERGHISEDEVWKHVMTRHNLKKRSMEGCWIKGIKSVFKEKTSMMRLVKQLKRNGYTVAILSNTEHPTALYLEERYKPHFHSIILSPRVGLAKPHKEIYEYALTHLGHRAQEVLFIDDKKENIEGAKAVGITTIHYTTHKAFLEKFFHYINLE